MTEGEAEMGSTVVKEDMKPLGVLHWSVEVEEEQFHFSIP